MHPLPSCAVLLLCLAGTGLAAVPEGYARVLITSDADATLVVVPKEASSGSGIVVQTRTNETSQAWYLQAGGNTSIIYGEDTTLCLDAGAQSNWKDLASIYLQPCADAPAQQQQQQWDVMDDGRIALAASGSPGECVDLQYLRAVPGNPVGLYSCAGLGGVGAADQGINWPLVDVTG